MKDFAEVDNKLAAAQLAIGESSNVAQIALTYSYNYEDQKYQDYVCILSVLAQVAIDNAKRKFDIDLSKEIMTIKNDMNIEENGLPNFWQITKKDKMKCSSTEEKARRNKINKKKIRSKINSNLVCPMNYLFSLDLNKIRSDGSTLPMSEFFIKHELDMQHRIARKVEELIEKYSLELYNNISLNYDNWDEDKSEFFLLRSDFDDLINEIRTIGLSKKYTGLMSWLINRAFEIGAGARSKREYMNSNIDKNKSILMKTLFEINKEAFLSCFIEKKVTND